MRHSLYSELRTVYEATTDNPRTFRLTIKLKDMVDETVLRHAVGKAMQRYPYFRVRLGIDENDLYFEDNPMPVPVLHTDGPIMLGGYEAKGHLVAFCWWKNKVHVDAWHALTDGGGIHHLIKTFLYYYCSEYYGRELSTKDIQLAEDKVSPDEWIDPAREPLHVDASMLTKKWHDRAFQIEDGGLVHVDKRCIVYNIRIPEAEFMRFNISTEGSPGTIISLFLARAISGVHLQTDNPISIALCVNQRRALKAPRAHQSLVGDARLVYYDRMKTLDFETQVTCFRGMVVAQSGEDMVRKEVEEYQQLMELLAGLPTHEERHAYCTQLAEEKSRLFTATVSYVGKVSFGDAEHYVQEFHALPSTLLPSSTTPISLELTAVNGSFYVNFMQSFEDDVYLRAFIRELRDNDIDYDVLYQEQTKYPGFVCPW